MLGLKKNNCYCCKELCKFCIPFLESKTIAEGCKSFLHLIDWWSEQPQEKLDHLALCEEVRCVLESYWATRLPVPNNNGTWIPLNSKGNGRFYFNDDYLPSEKNTRNLMTWKQLVDAYKKDFGLFVDGGVQYHNYRIDLKPYAIAQVKVQYEQTNMRRGGGHGVQDFAAEEFSELLNKEIHDRGYQNFQEYKDGIIDGDFVRDTPLVIHEDYDGETMLLVPKYLHDNWSHYGGMALASIIGDYIWSQPQIAEILQF